MYPGIPRIIDGLVSRNGVDADWWEDWGRWGCFTYLLLQEGADAVQFQEKLKEMFGRYMKFENVTVEYELMPLTRIHLHSENAEEPQPTGSIQHVTIFGIVASSDTHVMGLTIDTSNALHVTLLGITALIRTLLRKDMKYVLTGE